MLPASPLSEGTKQLVQIIAGPAAHKVAPEQAETCLEKVSGQPKEWRLISITGGKLLDVPA